MPGLGARGQNKASSAIAELGSKADWEEDGGRGEMEGYNVGGGSGKGGLGMGAWSGREALA